MDASTRNKRMLLAGIPLLFAASLLLLCPQDEVQAMRYYRNQGTVFGTYYNIRYEASEDLEAGIMARLREVDTTLSMFNPSSVVSRINRGEEVTVTPLFETVYREAIAVSEMSYGAFDITVAPLVNYWGFGITPNGEHLTDSREVDSIRQFVGYQLTDLHEGHLYRFDERVQLDLSAIAKGFACDRVADYLKQHCGNYLVDIGGEIVAEGVNQWGKPWTVGVTKPVDDADNLSQELQDTIRTTHISMATSGNYRRFYYEGTEKRSHTIDPRNGYPVQHNLLSATVVAESCMKADALATACMVLGPQGALELIQRAGAKAYLIIGTPDGMQVMTSENWDN